MTDFLDAAGWGAARQEALAGDASARRYTRLFRGDKTAILMQDPEGDVALFARLARHLSGAGLSAPRILAEDNASGLLLIEDLGDGLIARLANTPAIERDLYLLATDALIELHRHPAAPDLPIATPDHLARQIDLAFIHYTHAPKGLPDAIAAFRPLLEAHAQPPDVMVLRDYHAENILVLPDRSGTARAGLLDFQDALLGHRAYDLVSLLQDVRRDVSPAVEARNITHYIEQTGCDDHAFRTAYAALGAQRNLRILGVFGRLGHDYGKPQYVDMIPKVWDLLMADLEHPVLAPVADLLRDALPTPTPDALTGLRAA